MSIAAYHIRLPRRVTAYFLLFGLAAVVWLGAGAFYIARSVNRDWSESAYLRQLGRASMQIANDYRQHGDANLTALVGDVRRDSGADYCAIVSPLGQFLAHSRSELVGQSAPAHAGAAEQWGETERVQYVGPNGEPIEEYRAPLKADGKSIGTLLLGVAKPGWWRMYQSATDYAPLAIFGPACCMVIGAVMLNRMVRPVADIEEQLTRVATSPSVAGCELREVPAIGAAAMGWNRFITQRADSPRPKAIGEQIHESLHKGRQSRLDGVLNSIPDGVATTDSSGRLTYTNLPMATILGMNDIIGAVDGGYRIADAPTMTDQLAEAWQLTSSNPLWSEENQDRSVVTELTRLEEGQRRVVRAARHPICIVGGAHHESHVWIIRDVTQQKLAEEMRDQFVETATHELRTPLANIKAYAETLALADVIDVEQQKQFLNTINSEATRLARFVDDLLSVSSMELGSLTLSKQVTDLHRMLNEVLAKVRPQIEEKKLTFEVSTPEKLPEPTLDKDKIAAVLVNLLGNAIKYTPPGGRVSFRVQVVDQSLEMSVDDTGVGIAEDELPRVFEKFFRSGDPRVQEQKGTGLGLALAQEVVRLHGGRVFVESEIDKGSTFRVIMPCG
jgi:two-component system phosphate regulon sensor histidine kinase PhoR